MALVEIQNKSVDTREIAYGVFKGPLSVAPEGTAKVYDWAAESYLCQPIWAEVSEAPIGGVEEPPKEPEEAHS